MSLWTNSQINQKAQEAETEVALSLKCIIKRISVAVDSGQFGITLPDEIIGIRRVTWKGTKLFPITWDEAIQRFPTLKPVDEGAFTPSAFSSAFALEDNRFPIGKPKYYIFDTLGLNQIALFPTPNESLSAYTTGLWDENIENALILECNVNPDFSSSTQRLPSFIKRRVTKPAILSDLFGIEGRGQDIEASMYWRQRAQFELDKAKKVMMAIYAINNSSINNNVPKILARPQLPSNYGTLVRG